MVCFLFVFFWGKFFNILGKPTSWIDKHIERGYLFMIICIYDDLMRIERENGRLLNLILTWEWIFLIKNLVFKKLKKKQNLAMNFLEKKINH
jgi:hypothetical protein